MYRFGALGVFQSLWTGSKEAELTLDPPAVVTETSTGFHAFAGCHIETQRWNWQTFSGSVDWSRDVCEPSKGAVLGRTRVVKDPAGAKTLCRDYAFDSIPSVAVDPIAGDGSSHDPWWTHAGLGRCSLAVDGSKGHGFLLSGKTSGRDDASFKAVLFDQTLIVEVNDDVLTGPVAKWSDGDHLDLWLASDADSYFGWCEGGETERQQRFGPTRWVVRIVDGQVFDRSGAPVRDIAVTRVEAGPTTVRLRVELPPFKAITLVYSDSDDGTAVKSVLASSRLVQGDGTTLGLPRSIDPALATCAVVNGNLEPVRKTPQDEKALVGD